MKQYVKIIDGKEVVKARNKIVIRRPKTFKDKDGNEKTVNIQIFNPSEEVILEDGWTEYIPTPAEPSNRKNPIQVMQEIVFEQYNARTDISDKDALDRMIVIYDWANYIGKSLKSGQVVVYEDKVYRVRQDIPEVLSTYPPSLATASLYEVIVLTATGEKDDPIPYIPPMEIFNGKYYTQDGALYLCIRDSGTALSHNLRDLVGVYVQLDN